MNWLNKRLHSETIRTIVIQAIAIVAVSVLIALVWNRWVSDDRIPLVRRSLPTPVPTVPTEEFTSPEDIPEAKSYQIIDVTEAYRMFVEDAAVFVDSRLREEYEEGHIPGAVLLPSEQFDIYFPQVQHLLSPDRPLIVYCIGEDCELSVETCLFLLDMGYEQVYMFEGGWPKWQDAGLPQSKSQESETENIGGQ